MFFKKKPSRDRCLFVPPTCDTPSLILLRNKTCLKQCSIINSCDITLAVLRSYSSVLLSDDVKLYQKCGCCALSGCMDLCLVVWMYMYVWLYGCMSGCMDVCLVVWMYVWLYGWIVALTGKVLNGVFVGNYCTLCYSRTNIMFIVSV